MRCAAAFALALAIVGTAHAGRDEPGRADVLAVRASGEPGAYRFVVTVRSPDVDCDRYASWWEVVTPDGALRYRRILMHSHPNEQPFTRAGGPVAVAADEVVVVRAHLHPDGYGGAAFRGSVRDGFARWADAPADFAAGLASAEPQPESCWH
ncbi:MAG: hypothetical protein QNK03_27725 [Myxococcota bacterium]|nr:hypothetical protein [Myxococcota bacterium]